MIELFSVAAASVACALLPPMTQVETMLAFAVFFMIGWALLSWIEEKHNNLNAKREKCRIRKGNRRNMNVNVRVTHNRSLWIEETPTGKYARWM